MPVSGFFSYVEFLWHEAFLDLKPFECKILILNKKVSNIHLNLNGLILYENLKKIHKDEFEFWLRPRLSSGAEMNLSWCFSTDLIILTYYHIMQLKLQKY